jgi:hypothetical protein
MRSHRITSFLLVVLLLIPTGGALATTASAESTAVAQEAKRTHAKRLTCKIVRNRLAKRHHLASKRARAKLTQCRRARAKRIAAKRLALKRKRALQRRQAATRNDGNKLPAVSASPRGSMAGWNGFGAGSWPNAGWRPYSPDSPFNQPIPANAAAHPRSAEIVGQVMSWDEPGNLMTSADTTSDYGHPTYYAQPTDPLYTLDSIGYSPDIDGMQIRVPSAARWADGGDGHMTVVEPDGWEYDFWQVESKPAGGGTLRFQLGGRTRIDGTGLNSNATAARFGNLAGVIRAQELAAGQINHALFMVVKCTSTSTSYGFGTKADNGKSAYVFPATAGGSRCGADESVDAPPMGARFQLDMSSGEIDALRVPTWKKAILHALATYGGFVGDTGGPGVGFQLESSTMYTALGFADPLVAFARQIGASAWNGMFAFDVASGVDWQRKLRVLPPPVR